MEREQKEKIIENAFDNAVEDLEWLENQEKKFPNMEKIKKYLTDARNEIDQYLAELDELDRPEPTPRTGSQQMMGKTALSSPRIPSSQMHANKPVMDSHGVMQPSQEAANRANEGYK